jgi:hypothetical protein
MAIEDPRSDARVLAEIKRMMAMAHPEFPERERDHMSLILTTKCMAQALPGEVQEVRAIHAIGEHSICEFTERRGPITRTAYAALEKLAA